jgi:hypothetical protein
MLIASAPAVSGLMTPVSLKEYFLILRASGYASASIENLREGARRVVPLLCISQTPLELWKTSVLCALRQKW